MKFDVEKYVGIGLCLGYKNNCKKDKYLNSDESFIIVIPFFVFNFYWSREYKKYTK